VRVLKKVTELCRAGSKVEEENLKKPGKQQLLNDMITVTSQAGTPRSEPSCYKQKKEKEKTQIQASIA
jgi:hypothetical protein